MNKQMICSKLKIWVLGIRPKTLPASISPVLMGLAVAFYDKAYKLNFSAAIITLLAALFIQAGTNLSNDLFDYLKGADNKERVGPIRIMQSGLVTKKELAFGILIIFLMAIACGVYLIIIGGLPVLIIGILSIICGFFYTAGPRPIAYMGLGELFVLIFFGIIAFAGTYFIQTQVFSLKLIAIGLIPGFFSTAILAANNIRDIHTDKKAGKNTLVVRFGYKFGIIEYILSILLPYILLLIIVFILKNHYFSLLTLLSIVFVIIPMRIMLKKIPAKPQELILILEKTGQLMLIFTILFSITWNIKI